MGTPTLVPKSAPSPSDRQARRHAAQEVRRRERERDQRRSRIRNALTRSAGVLFVAALLGVLGWWVVRPQPGTYMASQGNAHVAQEAVAVRYASDPPTSGPHSAAMVRWGVNDQPIPKIVQVHGLEDGGVLVQYNCTDCGDLVRSLAEIVRRYDDKVALAPYPGMSNRIALTAWAYLDSFDDFDERRIVRFIEAHRGIDHHPRYGSY